ARLGVGVRGLVPLCEERRNGDRGQDADDEHHDQELDESENFLVGPASAESVQHSYPPQGLLSGARACRQAIRSTNPSGNPACSPMTESSVVLRPHLAMSLPLHQSSSSISFTRDLSDAGMATFS